MPEKSAGSELSPYLCSCHYSPNYIVTPQITANCELRGFEPGTHKSLNGGLLPITQRYKANIPVKVLYELEIYKSVNVTTEKVAK